MRHPAEAFVKAELAYRADPWNPGVRDRLDLRGTWGAVRRLGRRRTGLTQATSVPDIGARPAGAGAAGGRPATIHPFPSAPRQPDAA